MIEAYEIGITLALDNGVASGVAAIRRDLDTLDRAVAQSSAGLVALRNLSAGVQPTKIEPAGRWLANSIYPANRPTASSPDSIPIRETTVSEPSTSIAALPSPQSPPAPAHPTQPAAPHQAKCKADAPRDQRSPTPPLEPNWAYIPPPVIATTIKSKPNSLPEQTAAHGPASAPEVAVPVPFLKPLDANPISAQPTTVRPVSPTPATSEDAVQLRADVASPLPLAPSTAVFTSSAALAPARQPVSRSELGAATISNRPVAPLLRSSHTTSPTNFEALPDRHVVPIEADSAKYPATSNLYGEIILDGVRLGRWMADRLARATERPPSGMTGFDPRVSPNHAGAPNGS